MADFYRIFPLIADEAAKRRQSKTKKRPRTKEANSRHVAWTAQDQEQYQLIRSGIPFESRAQIDAAYEAHELRESHFDIWVHRDPNIQRNPTVPKYEATYRIAPLGAQKPDYARVKKCHLKAIYQAAGRSSHSQIWHVDSVTGLPYWVDRYAFSKLKQQHSKRKYESNKRAALGGGDTTE